VGRELTTAIVSFHKCKHFWVLPAEADKEEKRTNKKRSRKEKKEEDKKVDFEKEIAHARDINSSSTSTERAMKRGPTGELTQKKMRGSTETMGDAVLQFTTANHGSTKEQIDCMIRKRKNERESRKKRARMS
jgi:hypothetical protein